MYFFYEHGNGHPELLVDTELILMIGEIRVVYVPKFKKSLRPHVKQQTEISIQME